MKRWNVFGTLALVAVAAGVGFAAIPGASGRIDGCYERRTGLLRVIDREAGRQCLPIEIPVSWNAQGPEGAPGPKGDKGDTGDKGDPGEPGPSEARVRAQGASRELPEPPPFAFDFHPIVQAGLRAGTYVVMAKGVVQTVDYRPDARAFGECQLRLDDAVLDSVRWNAPGDGSQTDVALLATVTVPEPPDDPFALLPAAKVQCSALFGAGAQSASRFRLIALKVGALN